MCEVHVRCVCVLVCVNCVCMSGGGMWEIHASLNLVPTVLQYTVQLTSSVLE